MEVVPNLMVMPRCRDRLSRRDRRFVAAVLARRAGRTRALGLLQDAEARDIMLDEPALFRALQRWRGRCHLSHRLAYYVALRHVLLAHGLDDRELADYVAELLARRGRRERREPALSRKDGLTVLFELMQRLQCVAGEERFRTSWHLGDLALYLGGACPERLRRRRGLRRVPGLAYVETLGRANYVLASRHECGRQRRVSGLLRRLAREFRRLRLALNELAEQGFIRP